MTLESLLLSRDQHLIGVLRPVLEKLAIGLEVCSGARSGSEILASEKFDAVIVDCDDLQGGVDVLQILRKSPSNRTSVTFALLNGRTTTQQAFERGANFVLQKPVSTASALRCFGAALSFMARERRRYFRHPVCVSVALTFGEEREWKAITTNISEGGMAISFTGKLPQGRLSKASFDLPGAHLSLEPKVEVAWVDGLGRAGLRFIDMPENTRSQLDQWLTEQIVVKEPALLRPDSPASSPATDPN
jgi:c-di-GMP-binding flagellar brake protein YcgR